MQANRWGSTSVAEIYFRSLATENSSEYSTSENITDYSTSRRGEYFKQTLIIIFIPGNYYFLTKLTEQLNYV
jgi:hypothetical protein